jgi:hypothetical protein
MSEELKNQKHICPKCYKKSYLFSVNEINPDAPCIECQMKIIKENKR